MDRILPALSCCLDERSASRRESFLEVCLKTIGARDIVPCGEEMEEGSSRLAYRVRAVLAGLLETSDAILRRRGLATVLCAIRCRSRWRRGREGNRSYPGTIMNGRSQNYKRAVLSFQRCY